MSGQAFWETVTAPRVIASFQLSFGAGLLAAALNAVMDLLSAWVLVLYRFAGKQIVDALLDLPFALLKAVAGIALTALYAPNGWLGVPLQAPGIKGPWMMQIFLSAVTLGEIQAGIELTRAQDEAKTSEIEGWPDLWRRPITCSPWMPRFSVIEQSACTESQTRFTKTR